MNKHAANAGDVFKHLVLAEVLDIEGARVRTYVDPYAGRPCNNLYRRVGGEYEYRFAKRSTRTRRDGLPWADRYMELACAGQLGSGILQARYTTLLQGHFWPSASLTRRLYPGSVAIASALGTRIAGWYCGESDLADLRRLSSTLPPGAYVEPSLMDAHGSPSAAVRQAIDANAMVFVDPFNLTRVTDARRFVLAAARHDALVVAWYPLFRPWTPQAIRALLRRLTEGDIDAQLLEVNWSATCSQAMSGAGMLLCNLTSSKGTLKHLSDLSGDLGPMFGTGLRVSDGPRPMPKRGAEAQRPEPASSPSITVLARVPTKAKLRT